MTQFEVEGQKNSNEDDKKAVLGFLDSIDVNKLSVEVLDSYGWGDEGDPVAKAIEILKEGVKQW